MKQIVNIYKKGVKINLDDIQKILKSLKMDGNSLMPAYRQVLNMSSQNIANKWLTGRKYARTYFAQKAFGKFYPKKHIELSLTIDAMVDILDDFYTFQIEAGETKNIKSNSSYVIFDISHPSTSKIIDYENVSDKKYRFYQYNYTVQ